MCDVPTNRAQVTDFTCLIVQDNRAGKADETSRKAANKDDKVGKEFWQGRLHLGDPLVERLKLTTHVQDTLVRKRKTRDLLALEFVIADVTSCFLFMVKCHQ